MVVVSLVCGQGKSYTCANLINNNWSYRYFKEAHTEYSQENPYKKDYVDKTQRFLHRNL